MKIKFTISILAVFFTVLLSSSTSSENNPEELIENNASISLVSDYCQGFYSGYKDGWEEECGGGTSSPGGVCSGDFMSCPTMTPYKCGWTQGYKKGGRDGRARCK
tara:strand:+ start:344 stop:658 length:315 start_codon:yes stop_codon:yes gene_type:complete